MHDEMTTLDTTIPATQTAVQIVGSDQLRVVRDLPVPGVGPTQILLRIEACGICFSDTKLLHAFDTHPRKQPIVAGMTPEEVATIPAFHPGTEPVVPGHEPVARIVAVGEAVTRHRVGERVAVQSDYRHLRTAMSTASFGYSFDGGLEEYAIVDERVVVAPAESGATGEPDEGAALVGLETGERYLVAVSETPSAAAVALSEPWACVELAYAYDERTTPLPGGRLLVVVDEGAHLDGVADLVETFDPAETVVVGRCDVPGAVEAAGLAEVAGRFDDIIYAGPDAATAETCAALLATGGLLNIVTGGRAFDRPVALDVGRVHYDLIRVVGTTTASAGASYAWIPTTCELRPGERLAVVGAAGPMGLIHAARATILDVPDLTLDAVDIDDERLAHLHDVLDPLARDHGVQARVFNTTVTPLADGAYSYVALLVPSPALVTQAVGLVGQGGIVNAFAGFAVGTTALVDMAAIVDRHVYLTGTSGSRIRDMETVLQRLESGIVDTTIVLDAVCGLDGVEEAIAAVKNRTSQGKIMVYPAARGLSLTRLVDLPARLPAVAAALDHGRWTRDAETVLLSDAD